MTLLAETTAGMHNLFRMASLASLEGFFYKPRMDRELLQTYAEGLIATTGCPSGEVQTWLRLGQYDEALRRPRPSSGTSSAPRTTSCELMDHGLEHRDPGRRPTCCGSPRTSTCRWSPPTTCTTPARRTPPAHEVLLCVQSGSTLADPNRFKFDADDFYLKSPEEMRERLAGAARGLRQHAADRRALRRVVHRGRGPVTCRGSRARRGRASSPGSSRRSSAGCTGATRAASRDEVRKQAEYETEVISQQGLRRLLPGGRRLHQLGQGPRHPGRPGPRLRRRRRWPRTRWGSPTSTRSQHGLIFERFLNPERMSMPDFDVDFDERRRGEVIRYVTEKYGDDRVAQIVTYGTIKAKQAIKDSARVLGYPFAMGDRITKAMPPAVMGKDIPLSGIFDPHAQAVLRGAASSGRCYESDPDVAAGRRHRPRAGEPQAPVGRARGRRDHVQRAADRPHPDHAPGAGRRDHHPVRLPDLRGARPGQDGLPGPAQPDDPRRRAEQHRGQPRQSHRPGRAEQEPGRPGHLRAARPRRHPRRLPVRRRPDALAAAADAAGQLRGHLRRRRALPARPDGRELAHQLRAAQERPAADHADPPASWPSRSRRSSARPTA